jgi:hypothetical protein
MMIQPDIEECVVDGKFVDIKHINDKYEKCYVDEPPDLAERDRIQGLLDQQGGPMSRWHGGVLDVTFRSLFPIDGKRLIPGFGDPDNEIYVGLYQDYRDNVVQACLEECGRRVNMGMDTSKTFPSHVKWYLLTSYIPLPTASLLPSLDILFKQILQVFEEVRSSFFIVYNAHSNDLSPTLPTI